MLLTVAVFAMGILFSVGPQNTSQTQATQQHATEHVGEDGSKAQSLWVPTDSVGLYTLVLAVFTGLLVAVSGIQIYFLIRADKTALITAEAARMNAVAARAAELPIISFDPGDLIELEGAPPETKYFAVNEITVRNLGRTPAFPIKLEIGYCVGDLPESPRYDTVVQCSSNDVVEEEGGRLILEPDVILFKLDDKVLRADRRGGVVILWLYVAFHYLDYLNIPHEIRACWQSLGIGGFWQDKFQKPPKEYERRT